MLNAGNREQGTGNRYILDAALRQFTARRLRAEKLFPDPYSLIPVFLQPADQQLALVDHLRRQVVVDHDE
jgi:hypothetical protein